MAADASGASSSCSSYPRYPSYPNYDVFLNHRGPDLKDTFANDLYRALNSRGLRVFLDKPEMQVGHQITPQIESAIRVASVQVAIFSKSYLESRWCLDELVLMVDCFKTGTATIIPVFYDVEPSVVRHKWIYEARGNLQIKKNYDSQVHEQKGPRYEDQTIENWQTALFCVAGILGHDLKNYNGDGKKLLDAVVQEVMKSVRKGAKYPTGLKYKLKDFVRQVPSPPEQHRQTKVVGIVGVGGVGKTTLAKEFVVRHKEDYSKSAILFSDVREDGDRMYSLHLQSEDIEIGGFQQGKTKLENGLRNCRALIILDANIDKNLRDQLADFLQIRGALDPESLILITSHETQVLITAGIPESSIYQLTGLNDSDSKELFCKYAFNKPYPQRGFENLVDGFVTACCGLPLSLKVFGALVRGEDKERWKEQLDGRVHQILPTDIVERLKRTYDALNAQEQEMFEDIACLSIGNYKDSWIEIWSEDNLVGFQSLEDKSLVDVDRDNTIRMHDELMHFGRRQAKKHRRYLKAAHLSEQSSGITQVRGITMAFGSNSRHILVEVPCSSKLKLPFDKPSSELQFQLEVEGDLAETIRHWLETAKLMWFRWNDCPGSDLPSWLQMQKLRVLEVDGKELKRLWPCEDQIPVHLRELNLNAPQLKFSNSLGKLSYLTKIVSEETSLETLPEEFCYLPLKYIKLKDFKMVPDKKDTIHKFLRAESEDDLTKFSDLNDVRKKCRSWDMFITAVTWRCLRDRSGI